MSQIDRYTGYSAAIDRDARRDSRRASRELSRQQAELSVRRGLLDGETEIAVDKIDAVTYGAGQGMAAVVRVAQAQRQLELLAPEAAGRLALLADDHLLGVSDALSDLRRRLRRA